MKLIKTSRGDFAWVYGPGEVNQKVLGGIFAAIQFGKNELSIPSKELICGIAEASRKGHDVIEFGDVNGVFIFSRKGKTA